MVYPSTDGQLSWYYDDRGQRVTTKPNRQRDVTTGRTTDGRADRGRQLTHIWLLQRASNKQLSRSRETTRNHIVHKCRDVGLQES